MSYQIKGLDPAPFRAFFGQSDADLAEQHITRITVDEFPGYPDRVSLMSIPKGDTALLLNYEHLPVNSPYRARHAIFVHEGADTPGNFKDELPPILLRSPLSLRGIDTAGNIQDATLVQGGEVESAVLEMFENPEVAYIHAHFAARGCFAARIDRR